DTRLRESRTPCPCKPRSRPRGSCTSLPQRAAASALSFLQFTSLPSFFSSFRVFRVFRGLLLLFQTGQILHQVAHLPPRLVLDEVFRHGRLAALALLDLICPHCERRPLGGNELQLLRRLALQDARLQLAVAQRQFDRFKPFRDALTRRNDRLQQILAL